ncbi:sensor histidine kinase [Nonlabens tegetincola]|uniref:sensor histidine kinase n=1 Tax=Nonlabens tegetincola TaxID=323273 RepID=UPI001FD22530|nr:HAMP domain-containing sensor histidine kinase [Nonlabens tegetincola]
MNNIKGVFFNLIVMGIALGGILVIQIYWIVNGLYEKEQQFSFAIKQTLAEAASQLEEKEVERYYDLFQSLKDSLGGNPDSRTVRELILIQRNEELEEITTYSNSLLTENYKLNPKLLDIDLDSVTFTKLFNKQSKVSQQAKTIDGLKASQRNSYEQLSKMEEYEKRLIGNMVSEFNSYLPLTQRTSVDEVRELLKKELKKRQIDTDFEFAIYQDGLATRISSENFDFLTDATWSYPVFTTNSKDVEPYELSINLPGRQKYLLSSIIWMALLVFLFTSIIGMAYAHVYTQSKKQKEISQIKTDFINNMTHEFKTPIATINLALDSLKHPKIASDPEKIKNYLGMIREENKRMHSQVENVLQISKLEKSDLNLEKHREDVNELVEEAISHIQLILEEKNGVVNTYFGALKTEVLVNQSHTLNVFVNILENAIKYSEGAPIIDVFTENIKNKVVIKVRDNGIGMSKAAQRKIFQKFYREHTGDIHNVKGHGLGLAYAKRILDDCHGEIYVESTKGVGSTFSIHLPLLT